LRLDNQGGPASEDWRLAEASNPVRSASIRPDLVSSWGGRTLPFDEALLPGQQAIAQANNSVIKVEHINAITSRAPYTLA
jgi:hypothetical protein